MSTPVQLRPFVCARRGWSAGEAFEFRMLPVGNQKNGRWRPQASGSFDEGTEFADQAFLWRSRQAAAKWLAKRQAKGEWMEFKVFNLDRLGFNPQRLEALSDEIVNAK